jgi:cytochrome c peroxidase
VAPLRNVELTAPYFHSGAYRTLEAVVRHYNDVPEALRTYDPSQLDPAVRPLYHGESAAVENIIQLLDPRLRQGLDLSDQEVLELVAFLKALTDPAARDLRALTPASVPSGLPVR